MNIPQFSSSSNISEGVASGQSLFAARGRLAKDGRSCKVTTAAVQGLPNPSCSCNSTACPGTPSLGSPSIAERKMTSLEYLGSVGEHLIKVAYKSPSISPLATHLCSEESAIAVSRNPCMLWAQRNK